MNPSRWAVIALLTLILSCGRDLNNPFDPEASSPREAYFAYGLDRFDEGDLGGAREGFTRAVRVDPGFALAHVGLGWSSLLSGDPILAIVEFRLALQNDEKLPDALLGLAAAYLAAGDYERAASNAERFISEYPQEPKTMFSANPLERCYLILAESSFYLGQYSDAASALNNLGSELRFDPSDGDFPEKFLSEILRLQEEIEGERDG
jgi:tetratricopeptide (TPR) repeat protein